MISLALLSIVCTALAAPQAPAASPPSGVATFNDYTKQGGTVCCKNSAGSGPKTPFYTSSSGQQVFAAAAGDLSQKVGKGVCGSGQPTDQCNGTVPVNGYNGPACPTDAYCAAANRTCYKVTPSGGFDGAGLTGSTALNSIVVQVIDVCPQNHAQNYCPIIGPGGVDTPSSRSQHCEAMGTDSLDIDVNAYGALIGRTDNPTKTDGDPNLSIDIQETPCPSGTPTAENCIGYAT